MPHPIAFPQDVEFWGPFSSSNSVSVKSILVRKDDRSGLLFPMILNVTLIDSLTNLPDGAPKDTPSVCLPLRAVARDQGHLHELLFRVPGSDELPH